jgi:hypothetical protein
MIIPLHFSSCHANNCECPYSANMTNKKFHNICPKCIKEFYPEEDHVYRFYSLYKFYARTRCVGIVLASPFICCGIGVWFCCNGCTEK